MIRYTIKNLNGTLLDFGDFQSLEQAEAFFSPRFKQGIYGKNPETIQELVSEIKDDQGAVTQEAKEAIYQDIVIPADYVIEVEEVVDNSEQEKINAEARAYLNSTDWLILREMDSGVPCPAEIKQARAEARVKIVE